MTIEEKNTRNWIEQNYRDDNEADWNDPDRFQQKINLPSALKLIQLPLKNNQCNCFVFAFGLDEDKEFLPDRGLLGFGSYVQKLIENEVLLPSFNPVPNDYIIYKNGLDITHAGIVKNKEMVISKWKFGPIIEHSTFAVDPRYGLDISYYKKTDPNKIKEGLRKMRDHFYRNLENNSNRDGLVI